MLVDVSCGWGHPGGWMVTCQSPGQSVRHYLEVKCGKNVNTLS